MAQTAFDGPQIYNLDIGNYESGDIQDIQHQISQSRAKFVTFLKEWNQGTFNSYREQLINNANKGLYFLTVDLEDLLAYDQQLCHVLRQNPTEFMPVFEEAAVDVFMDQVPNDYRSVMRRPEFQVALNSKEHPKMLRDLDASLVGKLVVIPGIVTAASKPIVKAKTIVAQCKGCQNRIQLKVGPGFGGLDLPRNCNVPRQSEGLQTDKCPVDPYVVVPEDCNFENMQTLKLQEAPEMIPTGEMPRAYTVTCSNKLVDTCQPGSRIRVVGVFSVFSRKGPSQGQSGQVALKTSYVRAMGIMADRAGPQNRSDISFTPEEEEKYQAMARDPEIYDKIVKSLAPSIFGNSDVKCAIACMLFGGSRKRLPDGLTLRGDINVLLLGDPSTAKSQFLKFVERVAPISVYTSGKGSSAAGLTASVIKDANTGEFQLEGGAMVLADGGIVCIDEFDKMRTEDRVAIHEAMEQQTISVAKAGITTILNSRCSVLAAANPTQGSYNDLQNADEQIDFQTTILSRFDCIFLVRDVRDEGIDKQIAEHVLRLHMGGSMEVEENYEIDLLELKKYIAYTKSRCSPRVQGTAGKLLENMYVQDRQKSTEDTSAIPLTVRQLEAVIRLSESLARMQLSNAVTENHVTEAHRIFQVSTLNAAQLGMSTSGIQIPEEIASLVQKVEDAIRRRIAIGTRIAKGKLHQELLGRFANVKAVDHALYNMIRREEFEHKDGRRLLHRVR